MTRPPSRPQRGALAGLALLIAAGAAPGETLRERVHREYRHQSYMLIEDEDGARLYVMGDGRARVTPLAIKAANQTPEVSAALMKTRSTVARERVRGLVELAGVAAPEALDAALQLLNDPSAAVRDEAGHLILDHPSGGPLAAALGLANDEAEEQED
jgi:hypothetical protein